MLSYGMGFQTLIGRLVARATGWIIYLSRQFQTLIGRLVAFLSILNMTVLDTFQTLIGRLVASAECPLPDQVLLISNSYR